MDVDVAVYEEQGVTINHPVPVCKKKAFDANSRNYRDTLTRRDDLAIPLRGTIGILFDRDIISRCIITNGVKVTFELAKRSEHRDPLQALKDAYQELLHKRLVIA